MSQNVFSENEYTINLEKLKYFFEITTETEMQGNLGVLVGEYENHRTYDFCTEEKTVIKGRITTCTNTNNGLVTSVLLQIPLEFDVPDNQVELNTIIANYDALMNSCSNVFALKSRRRPKYEDVDDCEMCVDEILQKACNSSIKEEAVAKICAGNAFFHCTLVDKDGYIWWLDLGRNSGYYTDEMLEDYLGKGFMLTLDKTFYRPSRKNGNVNNLDIEEGAK